jgi:hypothetical protein
MTLPGVTPDQDRLAQQGRLDARCNACGEGRSGPGRCHVCGSEDMEYVPHRPGQPCLGTGRSGNPASLPRRGRFCGAGAATAAPVVTFTSAPVQGALGL